ncbi:MAG: YcxB family protein [Candidatus Sulfotelmatobacter sp.]
MIPEAEAEVKSGCCYNFAGMELRYKFTNEDIKNILRVSSRPLWALVLFAFLLAGMFSVGIYLVGHDLAEVGWVWLAITALLGVAVYAVPPIRIRRELRRRPDLQGEIVLLLSPEGIESTFATGRSQLQWRAYTKYKETAHLFVLNTSSSGSRCIPKRVMSPQQLEELRGLLRAQIPSRVTN